MAQQPLPWEEVLTSPSPDPFYLRLRLLAEFAGRAALTVRRCGRIKGELWPFEGAPPDPAAPQAVNLLHDLYLVEQILNPGGLPFDHPGRRAVFRWPDGCLLPGAAADVAAPGSGIRPEVVTLAGRLVAWHDRLMRIHGFERVVPGGPLSACGWAWPDAPEIDAPLLEAYGRDAEALKAELDKDLPRRNELLGALEYYAALPSPGGESLGGVPPFPEAPSPQDDPREDSERGSNAGPAGGRYRFALIGKVWHIEYEDEHGDFPNDMAGLYDVAWLLAHPGEEVPALDLTAEVDRRGRGGHSARAPGPGGGSPPRSSSQLVLDEKARREIRARMEDLSGRIQKARADGDLGRAEELQSEFWGLEGEAKRTTGLGGRPRELRGGNPAGLAKDAVRKRLGRVYESLRAADPPLTELADHLANSIVTDGTAYAYRPTAPAPPWILR